MKKFFITSDSIECANFIGHIDDNWYEVLHKLEKDRLMFYNNNLL